MHRKALLALALFGSAIAGAKTYTVTILETMMAGNTELKPGEYQLSVGVNNVVIRKGKLQSDNPVRTETAPARFKDTLVVCANEGGKRHIREIDLAGTNTRLVFMQP